MTKYVIDGNALIVPGGERSVYIDSSILESTEGKSIDTIIFEEGIEAIIGTFCGDLQDEWAKGIKTVVFPNSLVSIMGYAFIGYTALEKLELPQNLKTIGRRAFKGCISLRSIVFPKSLITMEDECFSGCTSLEKADLPESLTTLGKYAFSQCSSLKTVQLPQHLMVIEDGVFNECRSLSQIDIPDEVISIRDFAFSSTGIHTLVLPSSLQTIEGSAFGVVPELQVSIPCNAPVYTSRAFFKMDDLPCYRVFDPNQTSNTGNKRPFGKIDVTGSVQCPRCNSNNVSQRNVHKLFSFVKALACLLFFPAILLGFIGKNRIEYTCHDCGQSWYKKPGKLSIETLREWFMYL